MCVYVCECVYFASGKLLDRLAYLMFVITKQLKWHTLPPEFFEFWRATKTPLSSICTYTFVLSQCSCVSSQFMVPNCMYPHR